MTRQQLAQRTGWLCYALGIPLGLVPCAEIASHAGGPWLADLAARIGIRNEIGYFVGAVAGAFVAILGVPVSLGLVGLVLGLGLGRLARLRPATWPSPRPALRAVAGLLPVWALVFAPLSLVLVASLPLLRAVRTLPILRRPMVQWAARSVFWSLVAIQFWLLATWAPLLSDTELAATAMLFVLVLGSLHIRRGALVPWTLLAVALLPGVAGPFPMAWRWRALSITMHAIVLFAPWIILRGELLREAGSLALACFVTFAFFWGRLAQTAFMPSIETLDGRVATPFFHGADEGIPSGAHFLVQPCPGWPVVAGSHDRERGLVVFPESGGHSLAGIRYLPSDDLAADCERDAAYVGQFMENGIDRLSRARPERPARALGNLFVERLPIDCPIQTPWWLLLDRSGEHLYILDEQNQISVADLSSHRCDVAATGDKLWDFAIDSDRQRLILGDAGRVRIVSTDGRIDEETIDLPGRSRWILTAAHKTKVAMAADGTIYAAYMNAGTVAKLGRDPLRLEATARLGRGLRLLLWDERRNVAYVGNRVTGDLVAIDGATLAERGRVHVGRRMRTLSLTPDGQALLLGSVVGGVRVDVERLLGSAP